MAKIKSIDIVHVMNELYDMDDLVKYLIGLPDISPPLDKPSLEIMVKNIRVLRQSFRTIGFYLK